MADIFRVRLNCVDHYQHAPTSLDPPLWGPASHSATQRNTILPHVPVIRVFGATETGQKVCAHIHGALPYLYIPYNGSLETEAVQQYITSLRSAIDHAMALSYRRNVYSGVLRDTTFVAHISLVKGVPFFGYNVGYKFFLKIYILNPMHMTRFSDLLQSGAVMQSVFQPYEAHLQFLLQWMCDFNLYGCAYVEVQAKDVRWRRPLPAAGGDVDDVRHLWHDCSVPNQQMLEEGEFPRQSHCQLEIDVRVEDILNRQQISARDLHHSFIERLASLENLPPEEKLVNSMAGLWKDESRRRKLRMGINDPSSSPFPPEVLVSMSADPRNTDEGGWIHETEFKEMIDQLVEQERRARGGEPLSFESFERRTDDTGKAVQTLLQSVEETFTANLERMFGLGKEAANGRSHAQQLALTQIPLGNADLEPSTLVDAERLTSFGEDAEYGSDEDSAREKVLSQNASWQNKQKLAKASVLGGVHDEAKYEYDASDLEQEAAQVHSPAQLAAVKNEDGRFKRPADDPPMSPRRFKRPKASEHERRHVSFRVRDVIVENRTAIPAASRGSALKDDDREELFAIPSGQPPQGPSSQRSQVSQASSQSSLSFPVVKDPHDADVRLRLSQGGKLSQSPKKPTTQQSTRSQRVLSKLNSIGATTAPKTSLLTQPNFTHQLASKYAADFRPAGSVLVYNNTPPGFDHVARTVVPAVVFQAAYYSNEADVPERPREYAGQEFRLESITVPFLQDFDFSGAMVEGKGVVLDKAKAQLLESRRRRHCSIKQWELMTPPPSYGEVAAWLAAGSPGSSLNDLDMLEIDGPPVGSQIKRKNRPAAELSQIDGPTQKNKHGFKYSQHKKSTSVQHETGYMSTMSLEVHSNSRGELAPDPERDEASLVFWCLKDDGMDPDDLNRPNRGIIVLSDPNDDDMVDRIRRIVGNGVQIDSEDSELDVINRVVDIVRELDPDILTGYEVHNGSWGYLIERARLAYEFNLPDELSRMKSQSHGRFGKDADRWGFTHTSTVRITGRHTINIWRAMRSELNLLQYTMQNVVFHLLHRRIPHFSFATLTRWYRSKKPRELVRLVEHFVSRAAIDIEILDANELIPRTSEQARLLGVDFFSVFSRGSQFKVESLMFRIAKPESFALVSPSRKQVGAQNALECIPLVMEPQSAFYNSPLLVLDFQSLYPSVMIAYNYCYSTCLGRITSWRGTNKMGFADFSRAPGLLELVKDKVNISPNGMMFVKPEMRKSLLAKMLGEILETRVMVKSGMKVDKDDKTLQALLNNRQLALKLIANVTYGYTSASFSGRMPCSEIADSIVQTGRETLEKAIALIHSVKRWGAEVVYGDTDSLFVYLKGRSRDEAFRIGKEIAKAVTDTNPRPVKLKFEKVYHPCVLLAKKRYVGFKYESPTQTDPEFDAKGIETVRRDGTPAEQKIEEKALKLLFRTADLSQVKAYFQAQCRKLLMGRVSIQDFCFAKEVKLGTYSDRGPPPPGALIASRRMLRDPRLEPQYGERIPYVVVAGAPNARLYERCLEPERLLYDDDLELDAEYYVNKNFIPPLERIFNLVGANVRSWWDEMPKVMRTRSLSSTASVSAAVIGKKKTMENYMATQQCISCRGRLPPPQPTTFHQDSDAQPLDLPLCVTCLSQPTQTLHTLYDRLHAAERSNAEIKAVCCSCTGAPFGSARLHSFADSGSGKGGDDIECDSRDCPVFYSRVKAERKLRRVRGAEGGVIKGFEAYVDGTQRLSRMEW